MWWVLYAGCSGPPTPDGRGPADSAGSCDDGETFDGSGCVPAACGAGPWGDPHPDGALHVSPDGDDDAEGSSGAPLRSVQAAVDRAGAAGGGVVLLSAGTWTGGVTLTSDHDGVEVRGRCRELVTLDGDGLDAAVVAVSGGRRRPDVVLSDLTVRGGPWGGLVVDTATLTLDRVTLADNQALGLLATDADVEWVDGEVLGTEPGADGTLGRGVSVEGGATLVGHGCVIEGNTERGLVSLGAGSRVELEDCRIAGTRSDARGRYGRGIEVNSAATLLATRVTLEGNTEVGLFIGVDEATAELVDVVVRDTQPTSGGADGKGIGVQSGGVLRATRTEVAGNAQVGIFGGGEGVRLELTDTAVRDTVANPEDGSGYGVTIVDGATLTATGLTIERSVGAGLWVEDAGSTATVTGGRVAGTRPDDAGGDGFGVGVFREASATLADLEVDDNRLAGVLAALDATVALTGGSVTGTRPGTGDVAGRGVDLELGAVGRMEGTRVEDNVDVGVYVGDAGTSLTWVGGTVSATEASPDGTSGKGLSVEAGAALELEGVEFVDNADAGLWAAGTGTTVWLEAVEVRGTRENQTEFAAGVNVVDGAALAGADLVVQENHVLGLAATRGATIDVEGVRVEDTLPNAEARWGRGVEVSVGSTARLGDGRVERSADIGVMVAGEGSEVRLEEVVVQDTVRTPWAVFAGGVWVEDQGHLSMDGGSIAGTDGPGLYLAQGSAELQGTSIDDNRFAGLLLVDSAAVVAEGVQVRGTGSDVQLGGGVGVYALEVYGGPELTLLDSTIEAHPYAAVWIEGNGRYELRDDRLGVGEGARVGDREIHGNAVFARGLTAPWDGQRGLLVAGTTLEGDGEVAVLLHDSVATLEGDTWDGSYVGVVQQHCADVVLLEDDVLADVPTWERCPATDRLVVQVPLFDSLYLSESPPAP